MRTAVLAVVSLAAVGLSGCASNAGEEVTGDPVPTFTEPLPTVEPRETAAACSASPSGAFGLTAVTVVEGATGHPDGAKTVEWEYAGSVPAGTVTFSLVLTPANGSPILRGVKMQDGAIIANYVFREVNDNLPLPAAQDDGTRVTAAIPAAIGEQLSSGYDWWADLEIEGESTGTCAPND